MSENTLDIQISCAQAGQATTMPFVFKNGISCVFAQGFPSDDRSMAGGKGREVYIAGKIIMMVLFEGHEAFVLFEPFWSATEIRYDCKHMKKGTDDTDSM
jgi:hypothetical protein